MLVFIATTEGCLLLVHVVAPLHVLIFPLLRRHTLILLLPDPLLLLHLDRFLSCMLEIVGAKVPIDLMPPMMRWDVFDDHSMMESFVLQLILRGLVRKNTLRVSLSEHGPTGNFNAKIP